MIPDSVEENQRKFEKGNETPTVSQELFLIHLNTSIHRLLSLPLYRLSSASRLRGVRRLGILDMPLLLLLPCGGRDFSRNSIEILLRRGPRVGLNSAASALVFRRSSSLLNLVRFGFEADTLEVHGGYKFGSVVEVAFVHVAFVEAEGFDSVLDAGGLEGVGLIIRFFSKVGDQELGRPEGAILKMIGPCQPQLMTSRECTHSCQMLIVHTLQEHSLKKM